MHVLTKLLVYIDDERDVCLKSISDILTK